MIAIGENYFAIQLDLEEPGSFEDELNTKINIPPGLLSTDDSIYFEQSMLMSIKVK